MKTPKTLTISRANEIKIAGKVVATLSKHESGQWWMIVPTDDRIKATTCGPSKDQAKEAFTKAVPRDLYVSIVEEVRKEQGW